MGVSRPHKENGAGEAKSRLLWDCKFYQQSPSKIRLRRRCAVMECRTTDRVWGARHSSSLLILFLLVIFTLVLPACSRQDEAEKPREQPMPETRQLQSGGTYRRPLANDPANLDPARITDLYAVAVANQVFDSLVEFDVHLNVLPSLAQSWSASTDGLVWTFHLRKGVQFHNGRELTAEDVVFSLSRLLDPAVGAQRRWFLEKVKGAAEFQNGITKDLEGIKAADRYTVQIILSEPFAPFISILGLPHLAVVPREEVEQSNADFGRSPVGTGPFRFVRWERGKEIILDANEQYFQGRPLLDRIRFVIFPGEPIDDMLQAFERGQLEDTPIPPGRRQELIEKGTYKLVRKPTLSILFLGFNLGHSPLNLREIRQAFNYAVDRMRLNREIRADRFVMAKGILPPGMPGYTPEIQAYSYDPGQAKALLAQAGHPGGIGLPPMTVASSVKSEVARQDFQYVQQDMAQVGIQVELKEFGNWPTFLGALQRGEAEIFRYAWYADYPDPDGFLYSLFHSQSADNYFRYHNPEVDRLLDDARRETKDLQRIGLYRQAEEIIMRDAPAIMLLHYTYEALFQPYVKGIEISALGGPHIPMARIRIDRLEHANVKK
jgi:oligopeptide transport system substrate-binding protein